MSSSIADLEAQLQTLQEARARTNTPLAQEQLDQKIAGVRREIQQIQAALKPQGKLF